MSFRLPAYCPPDFSRQPLASAPLARFAPAERDGVAPDGFHATSIFPEYVHLAPGQWGLAAQSRMDCVIVLRSTGTLDVVEFRHLRAGDAVACGRDDDGSSGIYLHKEPFRTDSDATPADAFAFRTRMTRESPFSVDYDELYDLLEYEREHGFAVWVVGPAAVFDHDARRALAWMIRHDFVQALLAGNALATHDVEAALYATGLGLDLYTRRPAPGGHYHHLDALNAVRRLGSLDAARREGLITDGVMHALLTKNIPCVLAGSIRDDGPMPEVLGDAYAAQDAMRALLRRATTVIALATQLHTIAAGNMTPAWTVAAAGSIRPVYFYIVDMSEFVINKLVNRGSLAARPILTNVQDFLVIAQRGLSGRLRSP